MPSSSQGCAMCSSSRNATQSAQPSWILQTMEFYKQDHVNLLSVTSVLMTTCKNDIKYSKLVLSILMLQVLKKEN